MRTGLLLITALGAEAATWTGAISDAGCALKHANGGAEACVRRCVDKGAAPVLVTGGQVLRIANRERVLAMLGKRVVVTGTLVKGVVTVESINPAK